MIWGRTWRVLSLLGLHTPLRELAGVPTDGSGGMYDIFLITFCGSIHQHEYSDRPFCYEYRRSDEGPEGHQIHLLELPCMSKFNQALVFM